MLPQHSGDLNHDFASPLPTMMIAELMGIPPEDHREFRRMSDELTATYNEPDPAASLAPRQAFDMYFQRVIDGRRELLRKAGVDSPDESVLGSVLPNDLVSRLAVAEVEGRSLDDKELSWTLLLLLLGGNETSTAMITNLVWRLLEVPDRWAALREDPSLVDAAVEESLRFDPPVLGLFRTPTRDLTFVLDCAQGFIQVAECAALNGEVAQICRGQEISIGDLARKIAELCGAEVEFVADEERVRPAGSEVERLCGSNAKLAERANWRPSVSLTDGLHETIDWLRENLDLYKAEEYTR